MFGNAICFETDERQRYLSEYLPGRKRQLCYESLQIPSFVEQMEEADVIILPTPVAKLDQTPLIKELMAEYLKGWKGIVFGGKIEEDWQELLETNHILFYDFLKDESVALANAYVTAEATLSILLQRGKYCIREQKIVITGFGRCARELAKLLHAMGAYVCILARSSVARNRARELGYEAMDFSYGPEEITGAHILVNTVPYPVITEPMAKAMKEDFLYVDIASHPGGMKEEEKERCKGAIYHELALPSRFLTGSSGKILADMVMNKCRLLEGKGEKNTWILEILL